MSMLLICLHSLTMSKLTDDRRAWEGPPTLILGVDVGTTYSGVTFLYLTEGLNIGKIPDPY